MYAAASGHSTLGIPKKVGKDFVAASPGMKVGKLQKFKTSAPRKPKPGPGMPGAQPFGSLAPGGMPEAGPVPDAPPLPSVGDMP